MKPALDPFRLEHFDFGGVQNRDDEINDDLIVIKGLCADLKPSELTVNVFEPDFQPGQSVPLVLSFLNDSAVEVESDFTIGIALSRDPIIDPQTDLVIERVVAQGASRHTRHSFNDLTVTLPPTTDPIWIPGNNFYYLGMVLDLDGDLRLDPNVNDRVADCDRNDNITTAALAPSLNVIQITHSVGGSVQSGNGSPSTPYVLPPNRPATEISDDPGARLSFEIVGLVPEQLSRVQFERGTGRGVLYIKLDGVATPDDYDYRIVFDEDHPGPFDVYVSASNGALSILVEATGGITDGVLKVRKAASLPPPLVTQLSPSDTPLTTGFGASVTVSDNAVAGVSVSRIAGLDRSFYIYRWDGSEWAESKVAASDSPLGSAFGASVSLSDDVLVIGDPNNNTRTGSVYVYRRQGVQWTETKLLAEGDAAAFAALGTSISLSEDTLAAGAPYYDGRKTNSGGVVLYQWDGTGWMEERTLIASQGETGDLFGGLVSLSGDTLVVRSQGNLGSRGVLVYRRDGVNWMETQLSGSNAWGQGLANGRGYSLSLSGDALAIGIPGANESRGIGYIYRWDGGQWNRIELVADDAIPDDLFGGKVSLAGDTLVVISTGNVYVYRWNGANWEEIRQIAGTFSSVSLNGDLLGIGAPSSAYVYNLSNTTPLSAAELLETVAGPHELSGQSLSLAAGTDNVEINVHRHRDSRTLNVILMISTNLKDWVQAEAQPVFQSSDQASGMELWQTSLPYPQDGLPRFLRLTIFE